MSDQTAISWCDSTFNPWIGCTKVSPACDHCYAERDMAIRRKRVEWGAGKPRSRTSAANWKLPERWNRECFYQCAVCGFRGTGSDLEKAGCGQHERNSLNIPMFSGEPARRRVFCASLADWLDNEVPIEWLIDLLDLVRRTPKLDWLLLTKRIGNWNKRLIQANEYAEGETASTIHDWLLGTPPKNVWIGSTMVDDEELARDAHKLIQVPAAVRFISAEPMLGPMHIPTEFIRPIEGTSQHGQRFIDWVVAGGESGPKARPWHPRWAKSLRDQCQAAGVPFHWKQHGEWAPICQVPEKVIDGIYRSNRRAPADRDQGAYDELYGRTCTVPTTCMWEDGSTRAARDPMAFLQGKGATTIYRVSKRVAGRALDGREWSEFPRSAA